MKRKGITIIILLKSNISRKIIFFYKLDCLTAIKFGGLYNYVDLYNLYARKVSYVFSIS